MNETGREAPSLTVDALRALIRTHALTGPKGRPTRLRMPGDDALAEMTATVNFWAARVREAHAEAKWNDACRQANAAAATLRGVLPPILDRLAAEAQAAPPGTTFDAGNLDRVEALAAALRHFALPAPAIWRAAGARDRETPAWAHFAAALLGDLESAFGCRLPSHDTGAAARLLAAIVTHITGEAVAAATIGEMLRGIRKERRPAG